MIPFFNFDFKPLNHRITASQAGSLSDLSAPRTVNFPAPAL